MNEKITKIVYKSDMEGNRRRRRAKVRWSDMAREYMKNRREYNLV